jgi:hypothetical protein
MPLTARPFDTGALIAQGGEAFGRNVMIGLMALGKGLGEARQRKEDEQSIRAMVTGTEGPMDIGTPQGENEGTGEAAGEVSDEWKAKHAATKAFRTILNKEWGLPKEIAETMNYPELKGFVAKASYNEQRQKAASDLMREAKSMEFMDTQQRVMEENVRGDAAETAGIKAAGARISQMMQPQARTITVNPIGPTQTGAPMGPEQRQIMEPGRAPTGPEMFQIGAETGAMTPRTAPQWLHWAMQGGQQGNEIPVSQLGTPRPIPGFEDDFFIPTSTGGGVVKSKTSPTKLLPSPIGDYQALPKANGGWEWRRNQAAVDLALYDTDGDGKLSLMEAYAAAQAGIKGAVPGMSVTKQSDDEWRKKTLADIEVTRKMLDDLEALQKRAAGPVAPAPAAAPAKIPTWNRNTGKFE